MIGGTAFMCDLTLIIVAEYIAYNFQNYVCNVILYSIKCKSCFEFRLLRKKWQHKEDIIIKCIKFYLVYWCNPLLNLQFDLL